MNPLDILKYGHSTVLHSLGPIPAGEWDTPDVCGYWSTKDIIGHLAAYELLLVDVLCSFLGPAETPILDNLKELGGGEFNDFQSSLRHDRPRQEVLDEYLAAHQRVMELAPQIPAETWLQNGTLPWYGREYSLDDYLAYQFYGHKREHTAQIDVFKDLLKKQGKIASG